jgi:Tol biopolymer transport system component
VLGGCSFAHGTATDATVDGVGLPVDVRNDALVPTCYAQWLDNTIRFDAPVSIAAINSAGADRDPFLSPDELTIYWSSPQGIILNDEIWLASRPTLGDTFSTRMEATSFNSPQDDSKVSISADAKIAVVSSSRVGSAGLDLWESIRSNATDPWPPMARTNLMMVNSMGNEFDPMLSADGQHLYFAPETPAPQHLALATRGSNGMFASPQPLTELDSASGDGDPSPTPDERILLFASNRPNPSGGSTSIWYATRPASSGTFGVPVPVPDINTAAGEGDPYLSRDGCRLYFVRFGLLDGGDIYVATAM